MVFKRTKKTEKEESGEDTKPDVIIPDAPAKERKLSAKSEAQPATVLPCVVCGTWVAPGAVCEVDGFRAGATG